MMDLLATGSRTSRTEVLRNHTLPSVAYDLRARLLLLANDEGQTSDDLALAQKLVQVNPIFQKDVEARAKEPVRRDGNGSLSQQLKYRPLRPPTAAQASLSPDWNNGRPPDKSQAAFSGAPPIDGQVPGHSRFGYIPLVLNVFIHFAHSGLSNVDCPPRPHRAVEVGHLSDHRARLQTEHHRVGGCLHSS